MATSLRTLYRYWTAIIFLAVIVQIGTAGYGSFFASEKAGSAAKAVTEKQFDHGFNLHDGLGYVIFLGAVILVLLAAGAQLERKSVLLALAVPLLVLLQIALALVAESTPGVGVLHPINAFVIAGLTGSLAHRAWNGAPGRASAGTG